MTIHREVNGVMHDFELTLDELREVFRQEQIQRAKNIIELHEDFIVDESIYENESLLLQIADEIEDRTTGNCGEVEWEVLLQHGVIK